MGKTTKRVLLVIIAVAVVGTIPAVYRTYQFARDARGLIVIAALTDNDYTLKPYDKKDAILISPEIAVWLLENTDYPYEGCSELSKVTKSCSYSLIGLVGATLDLGDESSKV